MQKLSSQNDHAFGTVPNFIFFNILMFSKYLTHQSLHRKNCQTTTQQSDINNEQIIYLMLQENDTT